MAAPAGYPSRMPVSNEFLLALDLADLKPVAERLGVAWREPEQDPHDSYAAESAWSETVFAPVAARLDSEIRCVQRELLERRFGAVRDHPDRHRLGDYLVCDTPAGVREFRAMGLELHGDSGEMGDVWPGDFVWGVSLASRYFPIWLDWEDPHGTSGDLRMTSDVVAMIEEARAALKEVVPELERADFMTKITFY